MVPHLRAPHQTPRSKILIAEQHPDWILRDMVDQPLTLLDFVLSLAACQLSLRLSDLALCPFHPRTCILQVCEYDGHSAWDNQFCKLHMTNLRSWLDE